MTDISLCKYIYFNKFKQIKQIKLYNIYKEVCIITFETQFEYIYYISNFFYSEKNLLNNLKKKICKFYVLFWLKLNKNYLLNDFMLYKLLTNV